MAQDPNEASAGAPAGEPVTSLNSTIFKHVPVTLQARLGEVTLTIAELLQLRPGSVLTLDVQINEPVDLRLDANVVARGEIVAVGDRFGLRIIEVADRE